MPRGDYQIEDAQACKPAPQDSSYKMCLVTIGLFFLICIILLLCTLPFSSREEYRPDDDKVKREELNKGYQPVTSTERTTLPKYQQSVTGNDQLPTTLKPYYDTTDSAKSTPVTSTNGTTTAKSQEETKETDLPLPVTSHYAETESTKDDKINMTSQYTISTATPQPMTDEAGFTVSSATPEVEDTTTVNDDQYNVTLSGDENEQAGITENITTEVEDKEHVPYNGTSSVEEERNHEGSSTKPYELANETKEDGVTVSTTTEYQSSTSNEQGSFVSVIYTHEENATSATHEEEEHTETTFSVEEVEDNRTASAEEVYNQTANETSSEDDKFITVQTTTTTTHEKITNTDNESNTQNTVLLYQNQTDSENISLVEESHMEEEMTVTKGYTKEDKAKYQLVTPAANNNSSTEDDTTDSTTEDKMAEATTEGASKSTTINQSLETQLSTNIPACVLPNVTSNATRGNVCFTSKCKYQAKHLMKTMSFNTDACVDFYEFACGDVRTNKNLQPENLEQNTWDRIHSSMKKDSSIAGEKFKRFYNQCLYYDSITKEERINQAIEILQTVGTFYNNTSWKENPSNFTQLFLNMLQLHSAPLFDVLLDVDKSNGERFDFQIIPPLSHSLFQDVAETELQCREDILHDYQNKNTFLLNTAYEEYMNCTFYPGDLLHKITEALEKLSAFESLDEEENTFLVRLRQALEFSILPCKRILPNKREMLQKLLTKDFHTITVKELNTIYPLIEWDILLKGLLGKEVPENLALQLYFKDYFDELFHNMGTVEMYELHNAVLALFAQELYFNLVETKGACHRPSYCLKVASTLMQDVSSFLYLSSFTNDELQNFNRELQEISKKIKIAFKHIVEEEDTDLTAQNKVEEMEIITNGGMDVFGVKGFVESLLNDIEIDDADGYLINAVKLTKHYRKNMYQLFFKNPRNYESIWTHFIHPYSFQPVAIYPLNMVVIPYGYLGALQSHDSLMGYMRNVRLAIPLAQHMMHHFDTTGKMFNASSLNYDTFEYCLDQTYSSQKSWWHPETKQITDFKVEASLFHNQRLTDFLALRTVLEAYKTEINSEEVLPWLDLNQEQIYFLLFTQTLCTKSDLLDDVISLFEDEYLPPTLRVTDIMTNSEEFSAAYHCGMGIAMNPEIKCKLFTTEEPSYALYDLPSGEQNPKSQEVP